MIPAGDPAIPASPEEGVPICLRKYLFFTRW
jgi:hypothetical protein